MAPVENSQKQRPVDYKKITIKLEYNKLSLSVKFPMCIKDAPINKRPEEIKIEGKERFIFSLKVKQHTKRKSDRAVY